MERIRMEDVEIMINDRGIEARKLVNRESASVMYLLLKPGQKIDPHSMPVDVMFYIVEGRGEIEIGGIRAEVRPRDIVICPAKTSMALYAALDESFNVLNIKTPHPNYAQ